MENDIVVIPELGAFETKHISAKINKTTGEIQPPTKTVFFNPLNKKDDKIILNHLKEIKGLSENEASKHIKDFVMATEAKLKMKSNIIFPEVGVLYSDQNNKICLKDEAKDSLLTDNYGMSTVKIPKKKTQAPQKLSTLLPKEDEKSKKTKKSNKTLKRLLIALPFIALIVLVAIFYKQIWSFSSNLAQNIFNKNEVTDTTKTNNNNNVVEIDSSEIENNVIIDSTEIDNNTETPPDTKTDTEILENSNVHKVTPDKLGGSYKKYYLIVGSFENKSFANDRVNEMKKNGYSSCEILFRDNTHRVSIGGFDDINKAIELYNEFITTHNKNEIWLLRNDK